MRQPPSEPATCGGDVFAPLGSTGARLITTLVHELERSNKEYGLVTMCCGGGLVSRIVIGLAAELAHHPVVAVGVTPGWLRSESMLEKFGVTEETWRDALDETPSFGISESPTYVARRVAAMAADPDVER